MGCTLTSPCARAADPGGWSCSREASIEPSDSMPRSNKSKKAEHPAWWFAGRNAGKMLSSKEKLLMDRY